MSSSFDLQTVQFDARFPNTNQSKNCGQNYSDYYKCVAARGEDFPLCSRFYRNFRSLCPDDWIERWDLAREENRSPFVATQGAVKGHYEQEEL